MSGDLPFVLSEADQFVLAVIDALGHGPKAHEAATLAGAALAEACRSGAAIDGIVEAVHVALRGSRGAAMTIVRGAGDELEAAGVGNVALRVVGATLPFVATPGVLGAQVRKLRVARAPLRAQRVLLFSDGLSSRFDMETIREHGPTAAARMLLSSHGVTHDDATVLVADVLP